MTERFPADRLVVHEGDPGDKFYIIVRGSVQVTTRTSGTERELAVLQDGDHFGEIALLQDVPRTATIRTRTDSLFVTLSRDLLMRLMELLPSFVWSFTRRSPSAWPAPRRRQGRVFLTHSVRSGERLSSGFCRAILYDELPQCHDDVPFLPGKLAALTAGCRVE